MKRKVIILIALLLVPISIVRGEGKNFQIEQVYKTINTYDKYGNLLLSGVFEATEKEALSYVPNRDTDCGGADTGFQVCYETTYKKIMLGTLTNNTYYDIEVYLHWYQVPLITKYDDIAIRWTGNSSIVSVTGMQEAWRNGNRLEANYNINSSNTLTFSKGVGITMNMYDNATGHNMELDVKLSGNPQAIYATYQHARHSNITMNLAQSYSISSSGLGEVLYFSNSTTRSYYDGMQGVMVDYFPYGNLE